MPSSSARKACRQTFATQHGWFNADATGQYSAGLGEWDLVPTTKLSAPHTTLTVCLPSDTSHNRRRSARGCGNMASTSAATMSCITRIPQPPPLLPANVKRSARSPGAASQTTNSRNQFEDLHDWNCSKTQIVGIEIADIVNAILNHGNPLTPIPA